MSKPKVIAVVGPTSSGKTALGIRLAKKFGGEVISADSRQVYRGLNIGTGKVSRREMADVPHHMLDVASPKKQFSAGEFVKQAEKIIVDIVRRGRVPIVVGGTGFYADALLGNVVLPDVPPNAKLRKQLCRKTAPQLFAILKKIDPARAKTIDPYNPVRLIRAIEIAKALGNVPPITAPSLQYPNKLENVGISYGVLWLGIEVPQKKLGRKINERLIARIKQGMIAETKRLHAHGLSYKRMDELGLEYRYLARHLQGKLTKDEMIEQLDRAIRNYAKRQLRYLRRNKHIVWIKTERDALANVRQFLK
jgi:tRNA dimethylallyltransferase